MTIAQRSVLEVFIVGKLLPNVDYTAIGGSIRYTIGSAKVDWKI
jgi:hypothetical protein